MKYHFIINPGARSKSGRNIYSIIKPIVEKSGVAYEFHITNGPNDASEFAMMLTQNPSEKTIVVVGGDGTLNEVLNGLQSFKNITLACIPTGSGNDFARGLGLERNPVKAINHILNADETKYINFGISEYGSKDSPDFESRRFFVSSGIGYDARVCELTDETLIKKILNFFHLGKLTYTYHGISELIHLKYVNGTLLLDNGTRIPLDNFVLCAAMNLPYEGGGFKFSPNAKPDDGYLDVCVVNNISKRTMLKLLPSAYSGGHVGHDGVNIYRCKSFSVKLARRLSVHTDGETFDRQHLIHIYCADERIRIIF